MTLNSHAMYCGVSADVINMCDVDEELDEPCSWYLVGICNYVIVHNMLMVPGSGRVDTSLALAPPRTPIPPPLLVIQRCGGISPAAGHSLRCVTGRVGTSSPARRASSLTATSSAASRPPAIAAITDFIHHLQAASHWPSQRVTRRDRRK